MRIFRRVAASFLVGTVAAGATMAAGPSAFDRITTEYEAIRQALLHDKVDGVEVRASNIEARLSDLGRDFEPAAAGVAPEQVAELRALLPSLRQAAARLRAAESIEAAREAFGELSRELVHYRRLTGAATPAVAFCSMAQKVWLQPEGEIGNPYHGQSMARCGEIVSQ